MRYHQDSCARYLFSGTADLTVEVKFVSDQPLLPWQRKVKNFHTKITITQLAFKIDPRILHQCGDFGVGKSNVVIKIFDRPTPVAMVTKISKFHQKVGYKSAFV